MKRWFFVINLLILIWLFQLPSLVSAQTDTVTVDLQLYIPENGIFFLNDLNLTNLENAPLLFTVMIKNYYTIPKQLVLHFGIKRDDQTLLDGTSDPFMIPPHPGQIYLTSQNILSEGGQYSIQNYGSEGECGICYLIYFDENLQNEEIDINNLDLKVPIAVIALSTERPGKYTDIGLVQYTAEELEKKCESFIF